MKKHRIMVIGSNATAVQCVSRYCLKWGVEVLPYFSIPTEEEVTCFAPHVSVLCLPMPEDFQGQIGQPYVLWSEQPTDKGTSCAANSTELYDLLREVLLPLKSTIREVR